MKRWAMHIMTVRAACRGLKRALFSIRIGSELAWIDRAMTREGLIVEHAEWHPYVFAGGKLTLVLRPHDRGDEITCTARADDIFAAAHAIAGRFKARLQLPQHSG